MISESCSLCPHENSGCLKCNLGYLRVHEDTGMIRPFLCKMHDNEVTKEVKV
ncbi:hypothetical protein [uncultured Methanomethylovorans sp.]|uniref:hypothetical protein n=1 Tax=uncultured Methanomethylovorans sp. TaxID=183759 RepID=UPI002AA72519|nr:hypothetical protein [uncultured Methanomethylovorans sp.]